MEFGLSEADGTIHVLKVQKKKKPIKTTNLRLQKEEKSAHPDDLMDNVRTEI